MEPYHLKEKDGVTLVGLPGLENLPGVCHAFTTRQGRINLSFKTGDKPERARESRQRVGAAVGSSPEQWAGMDQVHGRHVFRVTAPVENLGQGDGQITDRPGVMLTVSTADCVPVVLADPAGRVGIAHAGWRGTAQATVKAVVRELVNAFGSDPARLMAGIGPCIGSCCYAVGPEVRQEFEPYAWAKEVFRTDPDGTMRLDLAEANARQLIDAGLKPEHIHRTGLCTFCRADLFFSHRRDGQGTGRMMGMVGIKAVASR